jgi:hypothetical protein
MALSNQSELPAFFSPRQDNLKISHCILSNPMIPEDDLPRLDKSQLTPSQNLNRGFDETNSLKPPSWDKRFRPVVSQK